MRQRTATRVSWGLWIFTMMTLAGTLALVVLNRSLGNAGLLYGYVALSIATIAYATAGALVIARVRGNPIGWALVGMGLALLLSGFGEQYLLRALVTAPGSLPGKSFVTWFEGWTLNAAIAPIPIVFLLFPTGRVFSPRWRWILRIALAVLVVGVVGQMLFPSHVDGITNSLGDQGLHLVNPTGLQSAKGLLGAVLAAAGIMGVGVAVLSIGSLVWRFHRAGAEERVQIKWLAFVAVTILVLLAISVLDALFVGQNSVANDVIFIVMVSFVFLGIPTAVAIAILKYRLYDIDVVINKTLVYGLLAAFITAVYVAIVVGIGAAIGQGSKPNLGLSILATAVVAVAFQPVRERVQRFANRLVYGRRATPYEVLSEFSSRMAGAYASEDLLPRMARILGEGTGAGSTRVWLKVGDELRAEAAWPVSEDSPALPMEDGVLPAMPDAFVLPVLHRGDLLGALSLTKPPGERLTPTEEKLAADLASGAGLVLRNVRLTEELLHRLEELRASRQRIVAAQDQERRRLERNIHDGAQQQLVALAVKVRLARQLTVRDPVKANDLLEQTEREVTEALEDLRDLARGIYPPLLADRGLVVALSAQARKGPIPVEFEGQDIARYPQEIEAAVYFCCLEALQNVAKYARASRALVRLVCEGDDLTFTVEDDGAGFDPSSAGYGTGLQGMTDRLAALGGDLEVRSAPGAGTTVNGRLPVRAPEMAR